MAASAFEAFLSTPEALDAFGAASFVQAMLDFEAALARAQAAHGLVPAAAAEAIAAQCRVRASTPTAIVAASGARRQPRDPARQAAHRGVAARDAEAARYVHSAAPART